MAIYEYVDADFGEAHDIDAEPNATTKMLQKLLQIF